MKFTDFKKAVSRLKTGDRVECCIEGREIKDAKINIIVDEYYICQNIVSGADEYILDDYEYSLLVVDDSSSEEIDYIRLFKKTLYNLEVGDIIEDSDGFNVMILGVHEGDNPLYHVSEDDDYNIACDNYMASELDKQGFKIKVHNNIIEIGGKEYDEIKVIDLLNKHYRS